MSIYNEFYDNLWSLISQDEAFKASYTAYNLISQIVTAKTIPFDKNWYNERLKEFNDKYLIEDWITSKQESFMSNEMIIIDITDYYYLALLNYLHEYSNLLLESKL